MVCVLTGIIVVIILAAAGAWIQDWIEFENYMSPENRAARREMYIKKFTEEPGDC